MNIKGLLIIVMFFVSLQLFSQKKAVFIIVDGIPPDVLEKLDLPVLNEISETGGYSRSFVGGFIGTYSESPTISAVGYNHLLTGTWTNKHNVWGNGIEKPNYNYQNIFRIAKTVKPKIQTAIFSTWLDNRTKLAGDDLAAAGNIHIDYACDGFENDTQRFPHQQPTYIFDIDELVSTEAARYIREKGPDLSWVYLEYTDDAGHRYGDSPEFTDAVKKADIQIGRVWSAIKERMANTGEQWLIVVTTDHGRKASDGKGHGGQTERERTTWISTNAPSLNGHFKETPGMVDILPSILNFMEIPIPEEQKAELDGVPFIGNISISNLKAEKTKDNQFRLTWNVVDPSGEAEILITCTNNFKTGGKDEYNSLGKVKVSDGTFTIPASKVYKGFNKILVKASNNWCNVWVM